MQCFSFQEFEKAFKTLKHNKAIGCNRVNGNIIFGVNDFVKVILFKICKASLEEAVLPEKLRKLFQFVEKVKNKMLKTRDQFLFFQFFPVFDHRKSC